MRIASKAPLALPWLALLGCAAATTEMWPSPAVATARGEVRVSEAENDNTRLEIDVRGLAPPATVRAGALGYVVWVRPIATGADAVNVGAIEMGEDLSGVLETVTPLRELDVFITAEPTTTATSPTGDVLLSARVRREDD